MADPKQATPDDLLTLAQLNEIDKNLPAAKELLNRIAGQEKPEPVSIVRMIEFLLRNGDLDEAETWIGRLEAAAPESFAARIARPVAQGEQSHRRDRAAARQIQAAAVGGAEHSQPEEPRCCKVVRPCMPHWAAPRRPTPRIASCTRPTPSTTPFWPTGYSAKRRPRKRSNCFRRPQRPTRRRYPRCNWRN